ncbi:MAG: hypothetical protein H0V76_03115 [Blastocatellia bacterium]|nr:hypothetical protein [Blastocatellia bacterium]
MLPASVVTARNASCAVAPSPTPAIELINAPRYGGFGAALKGADLAGDLAVEFGV